MLYPGTYLDDEVLVALPGRTPARRHPGPRPRPDRRRGWSPPTATASTSVRLTSGDPSVYSALTEQTRRLDAAGVPWDVTPGVPAYAAAAALRRSRADRAARRAVRRAHPGAGALDRDAGGGGAGGVRGDRRDPGAAPRDHPDPRADGRAGGGLRARLPGRRRAPRLASPDELVLRGTVADIADQVEAAGLRQAAVILVGRALDPRGGGESYLYDPARDRSTKRGVQTAPDDV